ncbi:YbaN family protein [Halomonas sp. McH1-25]|uniref:YbaN family protein n=1 Tax=unclassified Halomonas TaxID=2609666 RepID=UPI001EF513E3|nr:MULTISPECIES: YbaN family protein [unclassified Halomonas]MCG7600279.1 YbaN family protein [Halomonas sp. McH1-25]MCP1343405.1 YbaN family protein [Halomonas sp. FL8]MCP1359608.1 YbaN family protein [Halomonas sp. BBD45]
MSKTRQLVFVCLAGLSFSLGVVGLFLPLLPTTCFMLLAVWLASRGSPRFAQWIRCHPRFGPPIEAWEHEHAIPRHAKILAVMMLLVSCAVLAIVLDSLALRGGLIVGLLLLGVWIATRPEPSQRTPRNHTSSRQMQEERLSAQRMGR